MFSDIDSWSLPNTQMSWTYLNWNWVKRCILSIITQHINPLFLVAGYIWAYSRVLGTDHLYPGNYLQCCQYSRSHSQGKIIHCFVGGCKRMNRIVHNNVILLSISSFFNESWTKFHNVVRPPGLVHHGVRHLGREDHVQGHVVIVILIDLPLVT